MRCKNGVLNDFNFRLVIITTFVLVCALAIQSAPVKVIHDALLIHGHIGYSEEYPVEQRLRDAIGLELGDGAAQIQKLVIVREIMGREFLPY